MVENALKYRDTIRKDSFLTIEIKVNHEYVVLELTDNCLGIDKPSQVKLFNMFYKTNPESTGSGLGLYMTKVTIEKLEGSIILKSEEGKGTSFSINLRNHLLQK